MNDESGRRTTGSSGRGLSLRVALGLSCLAFCLACSHQTPPSPTSQVNGVPDRYQWIYESGMDEETVSTTLVSLPYTRVELERQRCFGSCPIYVVTFTSTPTEPGSPYLKARYSGVEYVDLTGDYLGVIYLYEYGRLCYLIDKLRLEEAPRNYTSMWTDQSTDVLRITLASTGEVIEISDYASQGPVELWTVRETIDAIAMRAAWRPVVGGAP